MDPDYVDEVLIRLMAEADHEAAKKKRDKRSKTHGSRPGTEIVDADLSEIT